MTIRLSHGSTALPTSIAQLERVIGKPLPVSFLAFIAVHDGAEPEDNSFKVTAANDSGVSGFIPVREIPAERERAEGLPATAFPIAWAEGGNYVCLDAVSGAVFFWDHEQPPAQTGLAPDLTSFFSMLEAFDPSTTRLKPGQVIRAWIDPVFLKNLGK